jgi:putative transposase
MRCLAAEKLEIIRLVEQSSLPVRRTLAQLGIPRATFYRWYDRHSRGGPEALSDRSPRPDRVWNRIPMPCASPTARAISSQRPRSTAC